MQLSWAAEAASVYDRSMDQARLRGNFMPLIDFLPTLGLVGILWYGGHQVLQHHLTVGDIVSANLFLCDRHCAYYWAGANDPHYRKTGCGTYLMIETIRRWQQKGLKTIDFVGINSPNRGDFKTSLNAIPVRYFTATWERPAACFAGSFAHS